MCVCGVQAKQYNVMYKTIPLTIPLSARRRREKYCINLFSVAPQAKKKDNGMRTQTNYFWRICCIINYIKKNSVFFCIYFFLKQKNGIKMDFEIYTKLYKFCTKKKVWPSAILSQRNSPAVFPSAIPQCDSSVAAIHQRDSFTVFRSVIHSAIHQRDSFTAQFTSGISAARFVHSAIHQWHFTSGISAAGFFHIAIHQRHFRSVILSQCNSPAVFPQRDSFTAQFKVPGS